MVAITTSPGFELGGTTIVVGLGVDLVSVICSETADETAGATAATLVERGASEVVTTPPAVAEGDESVVVPLF